MTDLSKLSDDELKALYSSAPVSGMSDAELQAAHQALPARTVTDKLTGGDGGERFQTWPERLVRGIMSVPERFMTAPGDAQPGSREFTERAVPAAIEAATIAAPVNPMIRAGDRLIPGVGKALRAEKPVVPTTQELAKVGAADINAAKQTALDITGSSVADYSRKLQQELFDAGVHPTRASDTYKVLKELESAPPDAVFTPANLQTLRETLGSIAQNFNPAAAKDQLAASRAIKGFDQFIPTLAEKDVLAGTPAATQKLFESGRGNYAAAQRSNDITGNLDRATTGILERAEGRAQAANSGRNLDNTIRSKVETLLEKPKEVSGFSDAELAALEGVRDGGAGRNTAREIGNLLGGGGGLGATLPGLVAGGSAAVATGNPLMLAVGAVPPVVGTGSRMIANALAKRDLKHADEMLRMRSPLYQERVANPEMSVISPAQRAALVRMLMSGQAQQQ